jgi:hypothetical protein
LENIEIPVLGGIPKIPKLFNFGLILADYGSFQQPCTASGNFQKPRQVMADSHSLQLVWQILADSPTFGYG